MKFCGRCEVDKPLEEFHKRGNGTQHCCKPCMSLYQKELRDKDKVRFNAKKLEHTKRRRKLAQEFVIEYLKNHPCVDCGEKDLVVLDFDHQRDKKFNVAAAVSGGYDPNKIRLEIEKCFVRCANCHRRKTAKDFGWFKSAAKA